MGCFSSSNPSSSQSFSHPSLNPLQRHLRAEISPPPPELVFRGLMCYHLRGTTGHGKGAGHPAGGSGGCTKINALKDPSSPSMD